jgi:hypothetical protein
MPYTNPWSVVIPAGGVQAKLIDDHIRQLRLDLGERFLDTLFTDMALDPLVLKDAVKGKKVDKKLIIPFSDFIKGSLGKEFLFDQYKLTAFTDTVPLICPIQLPPGVTLKRIEFMNDRVDAGSVIFDLRKRDFGAGFPNNDNALVATVTNNGPVGVVVSAPADFAEVIDANHFYWVVVDATGTAGNSFQIMGIRLTYDAPDSLSTI